MQVVELCTYVRVHIKMESRRSVQLAVHGSRDIGNLRVLIGGGSRHPHTGWSGGAETVTE